MKNSNEIRERLFDDKSAWNVYIDELWMQKKFKEISLITDKELLVIWMSLNIGPWQKAIKPGGSLYEGTFMHSGLKR